LAAAVACTTLPAAEGATPYRPPPVGHVFEIVLENEGYKQTFGKPSADPYLAKTLPAEGALLTQYYATGHVSNDNYVAMVSGQGPNLQNQTDCQIYDQWIGLGPLTLAGNSLLDGQAIGTGCVYPPSVQTIANQLSAKHLTWKGYMQDMGNDASREAPVCGHPALNSVDKTQSAVPGDGYITRHDPFVYFASIIGNPAYCDGHVVPLGSAAGALPRATPPGITGLASDLRSVKTTPNFSFIVPNVCYDGHDFPCTNQHSGTSALADIDSFLEQWVPLITRSPAFKQNGLLIVTFDEADFPGDASSCCGELPGVDSPLPGLVGAGGGRIGAVLLSPFIKGGTVSNIAYNHYLLLASIEDFFGLKRLGYAATTTSTFGPDVFR
jgi:hypothetical protein